MNNTIAKAQQFEKLAEKITGQMAQARRSHDLDHTWRVLRMAEHIGKTENADITIIRYAALLHDIARAAEDASQGKIDHAQVGAERAYVIMADLNLAKDFIEQVCHCIATHRYRGTLVPQTIEAKVLYDADKLDGIGAIGIGRAFVFAGENGARVHNPEVDWRTTESYGVEDSAWREYMVKLRHVKGKMLTATGKQIADGRHRFMEQFFQQLNAEVIGER